MVYCQGERVEDVTKYPRGGNCANGHAMDYAIGLDFQTRDTFVTKDERGKDVSFVFTPPKSLVFTDTQVIQKKKGEKKW